MPPVRARTRTWLDAWLKNSTSLAPALPSASTTTDSCAGLSVLSSAVAGPDISNSVLKCPTPARGVVHVAWGAG